jgi:glycosyltransferase involved in cell wall biosynthesis
MGGRAAKTPASQHRGDSVRTTLFEFAGRIHYPAHKDASSANHEQRLHHRPGRRRRGRPRQANPAMSKAPGPHIAVDLTPMLPGAENGGAKIFVLELLRQFRALAPEWRFTLLTPQVCDEQLAVLDGPNVQRRCILPAVNGGGPGTGARVRRAARAVASRLPPGVTARLIDVYWLLAHRRGGRGVVDEIGADLLFSPFTAPLHHSAKVPSVSVVYDLQFATYPQFFTADERYGRAAHLRAAGDTSARLVCISNYVRDSVLRHLDLPANRVVAIPIQLARRLPSANAANAAEVLAAHALRRERYLLYPANFWPHKNHAMLLLAFRQFVAANSTSDLALVCTGQPSAAMRDLVDDARQMGLASRSRFPGYVSDADLATLMANCRALVFPSLYEGFGMPLLEAMEFDRPVLAADRTAIPEVVGDAACTFDPRRPADLADAIERVENDVALREILAWRGRQRRAAFADPVAMASAYLDIFGQLLSTATPVPAGAARGDK